MNRGAHLKREDRLKKRSVKQSSGFQFRLGTENRLPRITAPLTPSHRSSKYLSNRKAVSLFPGAGCEQEGDNRILLSPSGGSRVPGWPPPSHFEWCPPLALPTRFDPHIYACLPPFSGSLDDLHLLFGVIPDSRIDVCASGDEQLNSAQAAVPARLIQRIPKIPWHALVDSCASVQQQRDDIGTPVTCCHN